MGQRHDLALRLTTGTRLLGVVIEGDDLDLSGDHIVLRNDHGEGDLEGNARAVLCRAGNPAGITPRLVVVPVCSTRREPEGALEFLKGYPEPSCTLEELLLRLVAEFHRNAGAGGTEKFG